ncbi:MAG: hypothetical protein GXP14_06470 [Gammaproteobacteria bacterium]|nr:hypothetical protein [Gammaproteobacteria bacterium]
MKRKTGLIVGFLFGLLALSNAAIACGGAESGKHIGQVLSMNSSSGTFTIQDAETNKAITFNADADILTNIKGANGRVMVNYEENDEGALVATSIAF